MIIQSGKLSFKNYHPVAEEGDPLIVNGPLEVHEAGNSVYMDDKMGIHSICNATQKPAVSLHLYAGPIERCRIYDESERRFFWKEMEYFTHPQFMDPQLVESVTTDGAEGGTE
jgi:hypothetical protein